ncbi:MAG: quinoprotein dehydrogenase-associated putative ABC transporter substrate-binding protein [Gammaproteobacteria bacterium]
MKVTSRGCRLPTALLGITIATCAAGNVAAQEAAERDALRVCADPFNLPMSNKQEEGYENKIAELFGRKLGLPVVYEWFPQRIGFIRNTLRNNETEDGSYKCDLVMGVIENFEIAQPTRPYLHSSWAMVYVKGRGLDFIESQDDLGNLTDEQKAKLRIGIWDRGPATDLIFQKGLMEYAIPFQSMSGDARENPGKIIERDLVEDRINLTFVWGPIAGYYAQQIEEHDIKVIPLKSEPGLRFDFQISMAVRFGEKAWKEQVDQLITDNRDEIDAILASYNVPMMEVVVRDRSDDDDDD